MVRVHINSQDGREVNFIQHLGEGKFAVNILDMTSKGMALGGSYSVTVRTDCECNVIGVN